nr:hypothetical protein [Tsukamurella pseudospumae]
MAYAPATVARLRRARGGR